MPRPEYRLIDLTVFVMANLANLLLVGIFMARVKQFSRLEYFLGICFIALVIPAAVAMFHNLTAKREWYTVVFPLLFILFGLLELWFDYILQLDFRNTTRLLVPYIVLFYLSSLGLIGYGFSIGKPHGFITLVTYFLTLFATWFSHTR